MTRRLKSFGVICPLCNFWLYFCYTFTQNVCVLCIFQPERWICPTTQIYMCLPHNHANRDILQHQWNHIFRTKRQNFNRSFHYVSTNRFLPSITKTCLILFYPLPPFYDRCHPWSRPESKYSLLSDYINRPAALAAHRDKNRSNENC